MAFCSKCGGSLREGIRFCTHCGSDIRVNVSLDKDAVPDIQSSEKAPQPASIPLFTTARTRSQKNTTPDAQPSSDRSLVVKAVMKALISSMVLSAIALGPGIALLMSGYPTFGMIWMFLGSFWLMARTYRKPWRLTFFSCFIPPAVALLAYLLQLILFNDAGLPILPLFVALGLGLLFGWWRASKHHLSRADDGGVIAKRTFGFLVIWVLSYGTTQILGYAAASIEVMRAGLLTGVFSTTTLIVVSMILWRKFKAVKMAVPMFVVLMFSLFHVTPSCASDKPLMVTCASYHTAANKVLASTGLAYFQKDKEIINGEDECHFDVQYGYKGKSAQRAADGSVYAHPSHPLKGKDISYQVAVSGAISSLIKPPFTEEGLRQREYGNFSQIHIDGKTPCVFEYSAKPHEFMLGLFSLGDFRLACWKNKRKLTVSVRGSYWGGKPDNPRSEGFYRSIAVGTMKQMLPLIPKAPAGLASPDAPAGNAGSRAGGVASSPPITAQQEQIAQVTAAVIAILVAAGIAVNIAQSIAAAIAQAMQPVSDLTANGKADEVTRQQHGVTGSESDPDPPLYDPYDKQKIPCKDGKYWAAREGEEGEWLSREEAERYVAQLAREKAAFDSTRQQEIGRHDNETEKMLEKSREDTHQRHATEREQEQRERERLQARRDKIDQEGASEPVSDPVSEPELVGTPGLDNTGFGWAVNMAKDFVRGIAKDSIDLIVQSPGALVETAGKAATSAMKVLSKPENWRIVGETVSDTLSDLMAPATGDVKGTLNTMKKVADSSEAAAEIAIHLGKEAWKDPAGTAVAAGKLVLGTDNWEKAIDPETPVTERMGRAIWGAVDTGGTLVGFGSSALKGAAKLGDFMRVADGVGDISRGVKAIDAASDATKALSAADKVTDAIKGGELLDGIGDAAKAEKMLDGVVDAEHGAEAVSDLSKGAGLPAEVAEDRSRLKQLRQSLAEQRSGQAETRETLEELRERLANQRRGIVDTSEGALARGDGIPEMATDPEGYVRELPTGALVDRNLAIGTGYSGAQIDDMARFAKEENVVVGARSTNVDSMRHIRDGNAVPKPITIKSKTIGELDTYLGAKSSDKGLVGYFDPPAAKDLDMNNIPANLREQVLKRRELRAAEYMEHRNSIDEAVKAGKMVERDGKLYAVIKQADGNTIIKPFAGDIDGVYFADASTGELIPPGERYDRLKAAWSGNTREINERIAREAAWKGEKPDFVPNYWSKSNAPGQHGVESNLVADITEHYKPGTPEYDKALAKSNALHAKLSKNHWDGDGEVVLQMGPEGHLRRGIRFSKERPLPDLAAMQKTESTMPNLSDWIDKPKGRDW